MEYNSSDLLVCLEAIKCGLLRKQDVLTLCNAIQHNGMTLRQHIISTGMLSTTSWESIERSICEQYPGDPPQFPMKFLAESEEAEDKNEEFAGGQSCDIYANRFQNRSEIGKGGRGIVQRAWDTQNHREVAIKQPRTDVPSGISNLMKELMLISRLRHPNIVPLYDAIFSPESDQLLFLTMPFLNGPTIHETALTFHRSRQEGKHTDAELLQIVYAIRDVCRAVDYAHGRGIYHLDLHSQNVKLESHGEAVVIDWGQGIDTKSYAVMQENTDCYIQVQEIIHQVFTDIRGIGSILFEVLTGIRYPESATSISDSAGNPDRGYITPLTYWPDAPKPLSAICQKCFIPSAVGGYGSVKEILLDVEHWLADEPVSAHIETPGEKVGRWIRKNSFVARLIATGMFLILIALVAGLFIVDSSRRDAKRQKRIAESALEAEQESLRLALDAGNECFEAIADRELWLADGMQQLRLTIAEQGLSFYRALLSRHASDPKLRKEIAIAWARIARIHRDIGRQEESLAALKIAIPILEELCQFSTATKELYSALIETRTSLAFTLVQMGKRDNALEQLMLAEHELFKIPNLTNLEQVILLGYMEDVRGHAAMKHNIAAKSFNRAAEYFRSAAKQEPRKIIHAYMQGLSLQRAADRLLQSEQLDEAKRVLECSMEVFDSLGKETGFPTFVRARIAAAAQIKGIIALQKVQLVEAIHQFQKAVEMRRDLVARNPAHVPIRGELAASLSNLGNALRLARRYDDAQRPLEEAATLGEAVLASDPNRVPARYAAGRFRYRVGRLAAARSNYSKAIEEFQLARIIFTPITLLEKVPMDHLVHALENDIWLVIMEIRFGQLHNASVSLQNAFAHMHRITSLHIQANGEPRHVGKLDTIPTLATPR